jgi:glycosyltransferase involved in cell wall biosynthesis
MRIVMFTNTYLPMVGGVPVSVERFTRGYRERGHRVLVVAPEYDGQPEDELDVLRVPALRNFNETPFSVPLPLAVDMGSAMDEFCPGIVHTHHPFLLGDTALRVAAARGIPIVATHHTTYENYTHYVPGDMEWLKPYVHQLWVGHANLCDAVIAPSESVADEMRGEGVNALIRVIPTGVDSEEFGTGDGAAARERFEIPREAFLFGHVGRLAPEKNLEFLARALALAMDGLTDAWCLVVGSGESAGVMESVLRDGGVGDRAVFAGALQGQDLVDAYHAFDAFAFASKSETQGMVLVEAMAAGCPVVALDAAGAREVVSDHRNGILLREGTPEAFAAALTWVAGLGEADRQRMAEQARETADRFSTPVCIDKALKLYSELAGRHRPQEDLESSAWASVLRSLRREWELWSNRAQALVEAVGREREAEPAERPPR